MSAKIIQFVRDPKRRRELCFCLRMISAQTRLRVCREGKPVPTLRSRGPMGPDHVLDACRIIAFRSAARPDDLVMDHVDTSACERDRLESPGTQTTNG